ncbi:MAG: hypothetical protein AAF501_02005 [Pseudomonadota bacterium]
MARSVAERTLKLFPSVVVEVGFRPCIERVRRIFATAEHAPVVAFLDERRAPSFDHHDRLDPARVDRARSSADGETRLPVLCNVVLTVRAGVLKRRTSTVSTIGPRTFVLKVHATDHSLIAIDQLEDLTAVLEPPFERTEDELGAAIG